MIKHGKKWATDNEDFNNMRNYGYRYDSIDTTKLDDKGEFVIDVGQFNDNLFENIIIYKDMLYYIENEANESINEKHIEYIDSLQIFITNNRKLVNILSNNQSEINNGFNKETPIDIDIDFVKKAPGSIHINCILKDKDYMIMFCDANIKYNDID